METNRFLTSTIEASPLCMLRTRRLPQFENPPRCRRTRLLTSRKTCSQERKESYLNPTLLFGRKTNGRFLQRVPIQLLLPRINLVSRGATRRTTDRVLIRSTTASASHLTSQWVKRGRMRPCQPWERFLAKTALTNLWKWKSLTKKT